MSHSLYEGNYCYYLNQKYSHIARTLVQSPPSSPTHLFFTHIPSSCFHVENGSLHPQAGARLTPQHSGVAKVSLGRCEPIAQSPTGEGDLRLTGSLEQSLEHWVSQGG